MFPFDVRSVLLSYVISNAICLIVVATMWWHNRKRSPAYRLWLADFALQFLSILLILLRGAVPVALSVGLVIPAALAGTLLFVQGLRYFVGAGGWRRADLATFAALIAVHVFFAFAQPSLQARNLNMSLGLLLYSTQGAWLLFRSGRAARIAGATAGWSLVVLGVASALRFAVDLTWRYGDDVFAAPGYTALAMVTYQMVMITQTFGLLLMANRQLLAELESDIAARVLAEKALDEHRRHLEQMVANRTEALQLAKDVAEAANRAKTTFLTNVSHELRTPMNGVLGMTALAALQATQPKQRDYLAKVDESAHRLLAIINNIIDIARIESERLALAPCNFRIGDVLAAAQALVGPAAAKQGLALHVAAEPGLADREVYGDPLRLKQVLANLMNNAVRFTEHGSVTVRVAVVAESSQGVELRWEVEDTGEGMTAETLQRIFVPFEQGDMSLRRARGGAGLGLAICKRLVTMMGGELGVRSIPGEGSTFWLTVPLAHSRAVANPANVAPWPGQFATRRVLIAVGNPASRQELATLLGPSGATLDEAADGAVALQLAQRQRYDLIWLDVQLPTLDGVMATQALRHDSLNLYTPVVAVAGNWAELDRAACLSAGMNDAVVVPVVESELWPVVMRLLGSGERV